MEGCRAPWRQRQWPVPTYRDEAVVLRTQKLGEADRIITLITRQHGRVRCVARGVRKTTSRIGARLEPFSRVDIQLYQGRNLDTVSQVESLEAHGASLSQDYAAWTSGTAMLETAERLTPEENEPALQQYVLLVAGLRSLVAGEHFHAILVQTGTHAGVTDQVGLVAGEHAPGLVLDSYLLRSLAVAGWSPSFEECARCGSPGPHRAFSIPSGGMVCTQCRPPGSASPSPAAVALMGALLAGDWHGADLSQQRERREASGIVAAYLQWHLERGLRSLPLVDRSERKSG